MGEKKHGWLLTFEKDVERFAGKEVMKRVMVDSEDITEKTSGKTKAEWVKGAMERLDALVDEKTRFLIMESGGIKCAEINKGAIEEAMARRKKFETVDLDDLKSLHPELKVEHLIVDTTSDQEKEWYVIKRTRR